MSMLVSAVNAGLNYFKYSHEWLAVGEPGASGAHVKGKKKNTKKAKRKKKQKRKRKNKQHAPKATTHNKIQLNDNDIDEKKSQQNDNNPTDDAKKDDTKVAILVIGNVGTGKSSLIGLLSGQKTTVASGAKRGTDTTSTIHSKYNSNIYFIDSVGLQDYDVDWKDAKLLKNTLKYIHHKRFYRIKIILCVSGETDERNGLFGNLSRFIGKLRVYDEGTSDDEVDNIWNSVLIIKKGTKKGIDPEDIDDFSAVMSAAMDNGATKTFNDVGHIFAFTCTDWMPDAKYKKQAAYLHSKPGEYEEEGYFTEQGAKKAIENKLNSLPSFELKFRKEECAKCGTKGDSRYVTAPCHTKSDYFHIKPLAFYHSGVQRPKHSGTLGVKTVHIGQAHTGHTIKAHKEQQEAVHPGEIQTSSVRRVSAFVFTLSLSDWYFWKAKEWKWYDCCNSYVGNATPCAMRWSCCGQRPGVRICTSPYAREIWTCCDGSKLSRGCSKITEDKLKWDCCDQPAGTNGCEMLWNCCNKRGSDGGCKVSHPCCHRKANSKGCKRKCVNCKIDWGNGPGCIDAE